MERLTFRSTSPTHLQAELRRHELLRDAARLRDSRSARRTAPAAARTRTRTLSLRLQVLIRRLAGS